MGILKFIYSEKATKFCEIFPLLLTVFAVVVRGRFRKNFVAFSEYMNFKHTYLIVKIYTLLGSFNDVKNASVRTHVLTGTYFIQIAQHISQKFYHQI